MKKIIYAILVLVLFGSATFAADIQKVDMPISYDFDCITGELTVNAVEGASVMVIGSGLPSQTADENGIATFTIPYSSTFTVKAEADGYYNGYLSDLKLHICSINAEENEEGCTTNDDCDDHEYCSREECVPVMPGGMSCGYVADHAFQEYECCEDSACGQGMVCINHECSEPIPENVTEEQASEYLTLALNQVNHSAQAGLDVELAQEKLNFAQEAYEQEDYISAKQFAEEAIYLAQNAQAPEEPEENQEPEESEQAVGDLAGTLLIGIILVILGVVISGFILRRKK